MMTPNRPKISAYIATSIDGYIAGQDGDLKWLHDIGQIPNEDFGFQAFMASVDSLVMGRGTYEVASSVDAWPYPGKRVVVLSNTLTRVCEQAELSSGDIRVVVERLHREGVKHIYADGGKTISQFINAGLLDELIMTVVPVVLGVGIPLFDHIKSANSCQLLSATSYENGLVQLKYALKI